jgi:biotin carboxyl carrier protein
MNIRVAALIVVVAVVVGIWAWFFEQGEGPLLPAREFQAWTGVEPEEISKVRITNFGETLTFVRDAERVWHFDDPQGPLVDTGRWTGVALLLSGPNTRRLFQPGDTEEYAALGLQSPQMVIEVWEDNPLKAPEDGTVVAWFKQVGDKVQHQEPLGQYRTGQGVLSLLSPAAGTLKEVRVAEGAVAQKDTVLAFVESSFGLVVGDKTPDGVNHYVQFRDDQQIACPGLCPQVYLIDASWGDVLGRLVTEPPVPVPPTTETSS